MTMSRYLSVVLLELMSFAAMFLSVRSHLEPGLAAETGRAVVIDEGD
jgi:hypothetical protein